MHPHIQKRTDQTFETNLKMQTYSIFCHSSSITIDIATMLLLMYEQRQEKEENEKKKSIS